MASRRKTKVDRFAKFKVAAVPVLLAVLGLVLWSNFSESSDRPAVKRTSQAPAKEKARTSTALSKAVAKADPKPKLVAAWPEPSLEFLNQESPFMKMDYAPPQPQSERHVSKPTHSDRDREKNALASAAEMLKNARIQYTFQSEKQSAFMFENRLIKEGDELTNDVIVRSITDRGIELAVKGFEGRTLAPSVN
ncbi:MAG: hypothetical protein AB8B50_16035 [Pirellulaceae bacterium]